ncbi:MAG TPA: hypothetical protein VFP39_02270 [Gemmatimonadales bacterium]|nr:hypothetical protein [Gemmatimonadales bacterium]
MALVALFVAGIPVRSAAQDCAGGTFLVSSIGVVGLAVLDIATAPASVRHYNERQLAIAPIVNLRNGFYGVSVSFALGRRRPPLPLQAPPHYKSPTTGLLLSLGSTTIPAGVGILTSSTGGAWMFLGGIVVGPSVGHFYAGQVARGLGTAGLRAGIAAVGISSLVGCFND